MRMKRAERREQLLRFAIEWAEEEGYKAIEHKKLATRVGCTGGTVQRFFRTVVQLRNAVLQEALITKNYKIIAQGLAVNDPFLDGISDAIKAKAAAALCK